MDELNESLAPLQLDAEDSWKDIARQIAAAKAATDPQDELSRLKLQTLGDYALELHVLKTIAERHGTVDISRLSVRLLPDCGQMPQSRRQRAVANPPFAWCCLVTFAACDFAPGVVGVPAAPE